MWERDDADAWKDEVHVPMHEIQLSNRELNLVMPVYLNAANCTEEDSVLWVCNLMQAHTVKSKGSSPIGLRATKHDWWWTTGIDSVFNESIWGRIQRCLGEMHDCMLVLVERGECEGHGDLYELQRGWRARGLFAHLE